MTPPSPEPDEPLDAIRSDPDVESTLKEILATVLRERPLTGNQILVLASELQRVGVHRLVQEHLQKFRRSQ